MEPGDQGRWTSEPTSATGSRRPDSPVPRHPWDGFVTGPENELAMAAGWPWRGASDRGSRRWSCTGRRGWASRGSWRPWWPSGCSGEPGSAVAHLEAEAFAAACAEARRRPRRDGWAGAARPVPRGRPVRARGPARPWSGRPGAADELAHTLDALEAAGAAVAVSARTAPATWPGAGGRAGWSTGCSAACPSGSIRRGWPSRRRFVLDRAAMHGLALQAEAVERLAAAADGYRTLDGWLARLALRPDRVAGATGAGPAPSTRRPSTPSSPRRPSWPTRPCSIESDRPLRRRAVRRPARPDSAGPPGGRRSSRRGTWRCTWPAALTG